MLHTFQTPGATPVATPAAADGKELFQTTPAAQGVSQLTIHITDSRQCLLCSLGSTIKCKCSAVIVLAVEQMEGNPGAYAGERLGTPFTHTPRVYTDNNCSCPQDASVR